MSDITNSMKHKINHFFSFKFVLSLIVILVSGYNPVDLYANPTWYIIGKGSMVGNNNPPGNFYRYAPSGVQYGATDKAFYWCGNRVSNVVRDHIIARTNNNQVWGPESVALCPGKQTGASCQIGNDLRYTRWDGEHVCDPEVIAGNYKMDGISYGYAMLYMGAMKKKQPLACTTTSQCTSPYYCESGQCVVDQGAVGVAFSNDPLTGPWIKYPKPLIAYNQAKAIGSWGVGQPSGTHVSDGLILLFYTQGYGEISGDGVWRRVVDLSNFSSSLAPTTSGPPAATKGPILDYHTINQTTLRPLRLNTIGLTNTVNGSPLARHDLRNVSFAYHGDTDAFFIFRDGEAKFGDPSSAKSQVAWIPASYIWSGGAQPPWNVLLTIDGAVAGGSPTPTGISNGGVQRDIYGGFYDQSWLEVFPSRVLGAPPQSIYTFRMNTIHGPLNY
ncbi:MAG: hypothetical protein IT528_10185 [Nitrosomonas sp.]|nr:hypothetical protein [Nitrosomonas sp.]